MGAPNDALDRLTAARNAAAHRGAALTYDEAIAIVDTSTQVVFKHGALGQRAQGATA
ncbi:MAG: hypothetical protein LC789_13425 [Actinobacteria bacterium]|nr:hypothetical protein [Actinomycetota bacterium]MCA1721167.1 hypothetical protein [Actinomycetota bacterium]